MAFPKYPIMRRKQDTKIRSSLIMNVARLSGCITTRMLSPVDSMLQTISLLISLSLLLKIPEPEIKVVRSKFKEKRLSIFPFTTYKEKEPEFYLQAKTDFVLKETNFVLIT